MNEKISIILPLYNVENYIRRCIESLINQTYSNIEIIAINDGSTDNTLNIIREYYEKDNRIIIIDKENTGVSDSRNIGIDRAVGEYILFVDGDDWLELDAIENVYNYALENSYNLIRSKYKREFNNKTIVNNEAFIYDKKDILEEIDLLLKGTMNGYVYLLFIKRDIIKNKIYFDSSLSMMEDKLFYLDLLLNNNMIHFYDKITYHYYYNSEGASKSVKKLERNYRDTIKLNEIIDERLKQYNLYTVERKKISDTSTSKFISETIYTLYKKDKMIMKKIYNEIVSDKSIIDILKNANLDSINKQNVYIIRNLIKKHYIRLNMFLIIRTFLGGVKTFYLGKNR